MKKPIKKSKINHVHATHLNYHFDGKVNDSNENDLFRFDNQGLMLELWISYIRLIPHPKKGKQTNK